MIKIAIYTGVVPSSTFLERLIEGLAKKGFHVYLFGVKRKNPTPFNNVYHFTCTKKRISRLLHFIKYIIHKALARLNLDHHAYILDLFIIHSVTPNLN